MRPLGRPASVGGGISYLFTQRIQLGVGAEMKKDKLAEMGYGLSANFSYPFNQNPGVQKLVPLIGISGKGWGSGSLTQELVTGYFGIRYYINGRESDV
jgi:hypothetical protein